MTEARRILMRRKTIDVVLTLDRRGKVSSTDLWNAIRHKSTANESLEDLLALGIVKRILLHDGRPRVYWALTADGKRWCDMIKWMDRRDARLKARRNKRAGED